MNVRFKQRWGSISVLTLLSVTLAACGGNTGSTTTSPSGSAGGSASGTGSAAPSASTGGGSASASGSASSSASTGGASASASTGGGASASASASGGTASPSGSAGAAGGSGAAAACPANAQGQQITMWSPLTGPDGNFMTQLASRFSGENGQGTQVTHQPQPQYYDKLNAAAASQTLPDVAIIHLDQVGTQASRNIIRPMPADVLSVINVSESDFPPAVWAPGDVNGERYSIPLDIHPLVMYYNQEMLTAAGINEAPQTKEEFEQAVQAMTQNGKMGWSVTTGFPIHSMFMTLVHQFGGSVFNEDGTEATYNSEAGVRALQYLKDAQGKYAQPNLPVDAGVNAFKQGSVGVEWNGIWQISNLVEPHEFGAAAPIPQIGEQAAVSAGSHQLTLTNQQNADPAKTAAAGCWISWLSANSADWAKAGQLPARNSVRESEAFQAIQPQATIAPSAEFAFFTPSVPGIGETIAPGPLEQAVVAVMTGQQTDIQAALDDSVAKANQILERNRQRYGAGQ